MNKKTTNPARKSVFLKGSWPRSREKGKKKKTVMKTRSKTAPNPVKATGSCLKEPSGARQYMTHEDHRQR